MIVHVILGERNSMKEARCQDREGNQLTWQEPSDKELEQKVEREKNPTSEKSMN